MKPIYTAFAHKIKRGLGSRGLTQIQVAAETNINVTTIGKWCQGRGIPKPIHWVKLIEFIHSFDKKYPQSDVVPLDYSDFILVFPSLAHHLSGFPLPQTLELSQKNGNLSIDSKIIQLTP